MNIKKNPGAVYLTQAALIAAVYALMTVLQNVILPGSASGNIQVRLSEGLMCMCFLTPAAIPGVTLGCILSNLLSLGSMPADIVFGSLATLVSGIIMYKMRHIRWKNMPVLPCLFTVLINGIAIGAELAFFMPHEGKGFFTAFLTEALFVSLGEAVSVFLLGLPLLRKLEKLNIL